MTDDTETNASMKASICTPSEELMNEFVMSPDDLEEEILMKCKSCNYEEEVPQWLLEEFLEEEILNGETEREYSCMCPRCNKAMYRK